MCLDERRTLAAGFMGMFMGVAVVRRKEVIQARVVTTLEACQVAKHRIHCERKWEWKRREDSSDARGAV